MTDHRPTFAKTPSPFAKAQASAGEFQSALGPAPRQLDAHVVILNNYLRPHHVASYRELAKRVRKLTILLSVSMEPDREWQARWEDLDVRLQRNWIYTTRWKHSSGFQEPNFIHVPVDTASQLKQLAPDIVFSYEMGIRTLLASWFRCFHRRTRLVMVGNMSDRIERERGFLRRRLRGIIRRSADAFTYNGPSCRRYLKRLNIPDEKLFHLPYCIDPNMVTTNECLGFQPGTIQLLYGGAISERKGILQFTQQLNRWCQSNSHFNVEFTIAGSGPLADQVTRQQRPNLSIRILGNCDVAQMREAYRQTDICVFPSLADEWGLVPVEAMASGIPVLGSVFAQSIEALIADDRNGWTFDPLAADDTLQAIDRALSCSPARRIEMGIAARQSVSHVSPVATADCFCEIIRRLATEQTEIGTSWIYSTEN